MAILSYFGTDLPVEILEHLDDGLVRVRSVRGKPFDEKATARLVRPCTSTETVVDVSQIRSEDE